MKSWVLSGADKLECVESDAAAPLEEGYARVKITDIGLSCADVSVFGGKIKVNYPIVPTRVATGLISEAYSAESGYANAGEDVGGLKKGQRVFLSSYLKGEKNCGLFGVVKDGFMSQYVTVPVGAIYEIPEGISDNAAVFIEDIALAINVLERLDIDKTQYIVLSGASHLNCIVAQLAIYYQAIPIVLDNSDERLEVATDCGCYYTINTANENIRQKLVEITSGKMAAALAFDTDSFSNASDILSYLRKGGKVCLYGHNVAVDKLMGDLSPIVKNDLDIYGVNSAEGAIQSAINMLANKIVETDIFVENVISAEDANSTLLNMASKANYYKTIISMK